MVCSLDEVSENEQPAIPAHVVVATRSPADTATLAHALGTSARPGDVWVLSGDLGAGKTTFTKAFGAGLGVAEHITSPTFTLAREYDGRLRLHHLDVYRLDSVEESLDLALPELLESGGVVVIEWGGTIRSALPPNYCDLQIIFGDGDDDRRLEFRLVGDSWAARQAEIESAAGDIPC